MRNDLLISDVTVKERTSIHGDIDPKLIYPDLKVSQDMYVMPILGSTLFYKLQDLIADGTITDTDNADYKNLIDLYITDSLIYHALSELPITISYQFWNKGVVRKVGDNTELPTMSELIDLSNKYKDRAEFYDNRLRLYLIQNANTKFREYISLINGIDTVIPDQKSFTNPIYLGPDDDDCGSTYSWRNKPYGQ